MSDSTVNVLEYLFANATDFALCWINEAACGLMYKLRKIEKQTAPQ